MNLSCGGVLLQLRTRSFRVCLVELFNLLWLLKKSKTNQRGWLSTQSHSQKQLSASSILTAHLRLLPLAVKSIFSSKLLTCQWLCVPLCQNKTAHMPSFFFLPICSLPAQSSPRGCDTCADPDPRVQRPLRPRPASSPPRPCLLCNRGPLCPRVRPGGLSASLRPYPLPGSLPAYKHVPAAISHPCCIC